MMKPNLFILCIPSPSSTRVTHSPSKILALVVNVPSLSLLIIWKVATPPSGELVLSDPVNPPTNTVSVSPLRSASL